MMMWQPIETAPKDNRRPLWLARFNGDTLQSFDYNGSWERECESWEMPEVYYFWASENGNVEEPTHWAYQPDEFYTLSGAQPAPDSYATGINAVAAMLQSKADEYAKEHGHDDMGGLSFGPGMGGEIKMDYYTNLIELVDDVRTMLADASDGWKAIEARVTGAQPAPSVPKLHVGNLPTVNQDDYPALGAWWVQLWDGDSVFARVYGESPEEAHNRASMLMAAQPAPSVQGVPAKSLKPVIDWLRNGCDPMKAAEELEILIAAAPEARP